MKSSKLMKKSLSIGLAVALAASSMGISDGIMNPAAVYAQETDVISEVSITEKEDDVSFSFKSSKTGTAYYIVKPASEAALESAEDVKMAVDDNICLKTTDIGEGRRSTVESIFAEDETNKLSPQTKYKLYLVVEFCENEVKEFSEIFTTEFYTRKAEFKGTNPTLADNSVNDAENTVTFTGDAGTTYEWASTGLGTKEGWTDVTSATGTFTINVGNVYIAANNLVIRAKETEAHRAGADTIIKEVFTKTLKGTVALDNTSPKMGDTVTAAFTAGNGYTSETEDKLQYQYIVGDVEKTASTDNTYTIAAADVGKTIKVKVTGSAPRFDETAVESENTDAVAAKKSKTPVLDGRFVAKKNNKKQSWILAEHNEDHDTDAVYAVVDLTDNPNSSAPAENEITGNETAFGSLIPGHTYKIYAVIKATEGSGYESSEIAEKEIKVPLLKHEPLVLTYAKEGKKITVKTTVENEPIEYAFKAGAVEASGFSDSDFSSAEGANQHSFEENDTNVTVAIRYKADDAYEQDQHIQLLHIDLSKDTLADPTGGSLNVSVNETTKQAEVALMAPTEPAGEGVELKYSLTGADGYTDWDTCKEGLELKPGTTVTVYVRAEDDGKSNPSSPVALTATVPARSAAPVITGAGNTTVIPAGADGSLKVILSAGNGAKIYYTADGSVPAIAEGNIYDSESGITLTAAATIKAIAVEEGKIVSEVAEQGFTKASSGNTGNGGGSSSGGGGGLSSGTATTPDTKPETKPDGIRVETTTKTNTAGKNVVVTTTVKTDANGNVVSKTEKSVIENAAKNTTAIVTVKTNENGEVTATASVTKTGSKTKDGTKASISTDVVSQITEAAGTTDVVITQKVKDAEGNIKYTVKVKADDLIVGESLKIVKVKKDGTKVLVNAKNYKVTDSGVSVTLGGGNATYELVSSNDARALSDKILKSVKVTSSSKSVKAGKKTKITVKANNKSDNVKKITYSSNNKSVATVDKNGIVTTKKKGTAVIKAKVTLKNGKTKTVTMKVKVK